jgi:hypothetical protein
MADPAENPPPDLPAPPRRVGPQPNWMTAGGPAPVGRGKALFVGLLLIVAVAGVLFGVLLVPARPSSAYLVSVPFSIYEDTSLPPVAFAEQDTKLLADCLPRNAENAYNAGELEPLRNKLKAIAEGKIRLEPGESNAKKLEDGQPFIFHVVGHAAVADDAVHILPLKADLNDPKTWLPLADLVKALADCPTKKKLLLLDLGRPRMNAFVGPLSDEVTPKLHEWLGKKRAELPCPVIVSCSPGEESLVIPQVGASAFAFYLAEGLRGAADGYGVPAPDSKVKVRELAEFVRVRTARWARQNRDLPQLVKLFEPQDFQDFDLMLEVPPPAIEDPEPFKLAYSRIGVADGWTARGELAPEAVRRAAPALARWAATVVRAEEIYGANPSDPRVADAVRTAGHWWDDVRRAAQPTDRIAYRSLRAVVVPPAPSGMPSPPDPVALFKTALEKYARTALPEAGTKVNDSDLSARKAEYELAANGVSPAVGARLVWDWLLEKYPENAQPRARDIAFAWSAMKYALRNELELFVEALALQRISVLDAPPYERPEARATVMKFLRLEATASAALMHGSPGFAWVRPYADAADEAKLAAEGMFFRATMRSEVEAADRALDAARIKYSDVGERLAALAAARESLEDALGVLVGTALSHAEFEWPISTERDAASFKDWMELAARSKALADELYRAPPAEWDAAGLRRAARDLADGTKKIARETDSTAAKRFIDSAPSARPADLRRFQAALRTTTLAGADRGKVWDAAAGIAERLHLATRKDADLLDNESRSVTKPPTLPAPLPDGRPRRAEVGVRLLELGGHPDGGKLRAQLDDLRRGDNTEKWRALTTDLRKAWDRMAFAKRLADANDLERVDRLARVVPAGVWQDAPDKSNAPDWRSAPARRHNRNELVWRVWLATHYRKYATARTDVPDATDRYQKAAQDADRKSRD